MSEAHTLVSLALLYAHLSLIAVGGGIAVLPEMQRQVVELHGWMTSAEFAELFALAQAAPGPNILVVTLIGWNVAGFLGALVATVAMTAPSALLTYGVAYVWDRFRHKPWRIALQAGLAPITVGLILAGGYFVTRAAVHSVPAYAICAATFAIVFFTRIHPLWMFALAGALGLMNLV
ncbi:MAG TPA: chromate transporter [Alphaproteobacteria bacterium]|nr:chromate transporter [Alphaproteobacteria bacterium]